MEPVPERHISRHVTSLETVSVSMPLTQCACSLCYPQQSFQLRTGAVTGRGVGVAALQFIKPNDISYYQIRRSNRGTLLLQTSVPGRIC